MKVISCGVGFTFALFLEICNFNVLMHSHPHATFKYCIYRFLYLLLQCIRRPFPPALNCYLPRRRIDPCLKFRDKVSKVFQYTPQNNHDSIQYTIYNYSLYKNIVLIISALRYQTPLSMKVISCGVGFTFALFLEIYNFNVLMHSHPHAKYIVFTNFYH